MLFFFFKQKTAYEIVRSRGLGDVYKRQVYDAVLSVQKDCVAMLKPGVTYDELQNRAREGLVLSLIHI